MFDGIFFVVFAFFFVSVNETYRGLSFLFFLFGLIFLLSTFLKKKLVSVSPSLRPETSFLFFSGNYSEICIVNSFSLWTIRIIFSSSVVFRFIRFLKFTAFLFFFWVSEIHFSSDFTEKIGSNSTRRTLNSGDFVCMVDLTMGSHVGVRCSVKNDGFEPLAPPSSMYNLTLHEVQSQLGDTGKPLSSMNLDELLQNVLSAEAANQSVGTEPEDVPPGNQNGSTQCRASLSSLTGTLSKKTVDEVWRDIQEQSKGRGGDRIKERQPTLGEITLEDFLVKAGVVSESNVGKENCGHFPGVDPNIDPQFLMEQHQWMQPMAQPLQARTRLENQAVLPPPPLMGTLSETQVPGRKRGATEEFIGKTVERRQKRMIKNRESAARSRARKQAYTNELENKVSRLEEENEKLRKQKELEKILPVTPVAETKYQLRRTSSAPV
ncbi:PREDICTED: ABSCISIC ACID-INSENSITIVE 5-like protein 2 isoform X2 [Tarenaya hassleriana]|uniref:ABSCISIC ACID-INSENSITIVE 5-like protein 2 isoform X2 n=1 Tax=Tarenaya hassleriana TaxID=28532 RepID=UPI00053C9464|nr:PREDICTED: ABSCISIC ACID-INSENSITIVE 5-like protein 2 isoform X2 [Tarenaya hassleriana]